MLQGWTTIDLSKEGDPYPILLRMRDPLELLKELLADPANSPGFAYGPRATYDASGRRTVSDPETATWWEDAQVSPKQVAMIGQSAVGMSLSFSCIITGESAPTLLRLWSWITIEMYSQACSHAPILQGCRCFGNVHGLISVSFST